MKAVATIVILFFIASCKMEYKHADNDVQGYHWIGVNGNQEIKNDTIFSYSKMIGDGDFDFHIIKNVADSVIQFTDSNGEKSQQATFKLQAIDDCPYLILYYDSSVSMFTRRRVCPINFKNIF